MSALHEIVAARTAKTKTLVDQLMVLVSRCRKHDLFNGFSKRYDPKEEEGTQYPTEGTLVRETTTGALEEAWRYLRPLLDLEAANDAGNRVAKSDVHLPGASTCLCIDVPVTTLMSMEKWVSNLRDFVKVLPTLDMAFVWAWDERTGMYVSPEKERFKTIKKQRVLIKYEATKDHPAQTEVISVDVLEGSWHTKNFSATMAPHTKKLLLERVDDLAVAIRQARERANTIKIDAPPEYADELLNFVFQGIETVTKGDHE